MADFAKWAIACEPALWKDGEFLRAYRANIEGAVETVLEASPVAVAVRGWMATAKDGTEGLTTAQDGTKTWEGTSSALLPLLTGFVDEKVAKSKEWPGSARALSGRLRRAASFLRRVGINVVFVREGHARSRQITITRAPTEDKGKSASASSAQELSQCFL